MQGADMNNDKHKDGVSGFFNVDTVSPFKKGSKRGTSTIKNAIAHNRRTTQAAYGSRSNIDPSRSHLNYCLEADASPSAIVARVKSGMVEHKARKNAPHAIEALVSLPVNWKGDLRLLCVDTVAYLKKMLGAGNLLSADVHLDEPNRHMHVLFMPLEYCEKKGRLVWRSTINKRTREIYDGFFSEVGEKHGVRKPIQLSAKVRSMLAEAVIDAMNRSGDAAIRSCAWEAVKKSIKAAPQEFAGLLGINLDAFVEATNHLGSLAVADNHLGSSEAVGAELIQNSLPVYGVSESTALRIDKETGEIKTERPFIEVNESGSKPSTTSPKVGAEALDGIGCTVERDSGKCPQNGYWDDSNEWIAYPEKQPSEARLKAQALGKTVLLRKNAFLK
jgi:Plasmid recombination enzyme